MKKTKVQNRSTKNDPIIKELPLACADEKAAVEFLEKQRWGKTPCCPRCGSVDVYKMKDNKTGERQKNFRLLCRDCKRARNKHQFTVRTDTVFEDSRIDLRHWCFAFWRAATSKKGVSALEIHRQTGISYKSSLFLLNRVRYAMADSATGPMGPKHKDVEIDETYIGGKERNKKPSKRGKKIKKQVVIAMIERGGKVRTKPIPDVTSKTVKEVVLSNVHKGARIITDENRSYHGLGSKFEGGHHTVCHGKDEYVRGDVYTNTAEGFFSMVKRSLNGIYHSVSKEHLHRYLAECEFRHNHRDLEDGERTLAVIKASEGKRLIYREPISNK